MDVIGELAALAAAFCWAISPVLYKMALSNAKPIPANVACIGAFVLKEKVTVRIFVGAVLIVLGISVIFIF